MRNKLIVIGMLFLSVSCGGTKQPKGYVAEGEIYVPEREIYLCVENENKVDTISKSKIIDGKFKFEGVTDLPQNAYIVCDDYRKIDLVLENCNYHFKIDILDDTKIMAEISGEESKIKSALDTLKTEFRDKKESIYRQMHQKKITNDEATVLVTKLREEYNQREENLIIKPNSNSFVAMNLVYDSRNYLSDEEFCQRFDLLGDKYSSHRMYKEMAKSYKIYKNIRVGKVAPNFTVMKENGDSISLYSIKSKFKVIYAKQDGCLSEENIDSLFRRMYAKHVRANLEIIELSDNHTKEDWIQILLSDVWNNPILTEYNRKRVPYIYLLDAENKFLAIGTTATEIEKIII